MAGGRSSRMRAAFAGRHKSLVPILGVPMLERNLTWLLALGFREVYLAIAETEHALRDFARSRCRNLAAGFGANLSVVEERVPLGTIGACRLCNTEDDLVVVNVDNLTSLDLCAMLDSHRRAGAAMTIATHRETFRMPFGQVVLEGQYVVDVLEKPETGYQISSGTYVLSWRARQAIPAERNIGAPELFHRLKAGGERTLAFAHSSPWIDVNDADAVRRAESLIAAHYRDFECPWSRAGSERIVVLLANGPLVLAERRSSPSRLGLELGQGVTPLSAAEACAQAPRFVTSFDEAGCDGRVIRFHLFIAGFPLVAASPPYWCDAGELAAQTLPEFERCMAYWRLDGAGAAP